ncbi:Trypsin [Corynebacterium mustelae]|uniref:Trypsin n=1 Tax=Corynebacterium mustelae TaxID=571915 RepID=A0A0G3GWS9_9CORY|nr:S1 family peptidase [Corynebacterium mustelae]AKK05000.1 Trypsin [Corynebacterium mustelae]
MAKQHIAATLSALLVATVCSVAPSAHALTGGRLTLENEIEANKVVKVHAGQALCTGVAIDEHWVLTARHCKIGNTSNFTVETGTKPGGKRVSTQTFLAAPQGDIALLFFEEGLGLPHYADIARELPAKQTRGTNYGWGTGTGPILRLSHQQFLGTYNTSGYNNATMFVTENEDGALNRPGDSGGPVFFHGLVTGIASSVSGNPKTNFSSVPQAYDWIVQTVNSRPQPRSSTFMPSIDPAVVSKLNERILAAEQQRNIANQNAKEKIAAATLAQQTAEQKVQEAEEARLAAEQEAEEAKEAQREAEELKDASLQESAAAQERAAAAQRKAEEAEQARETAEAAAREAQDARTVAQQLQSEAESAKTKAQESLKAEQALRAEAEKLRAAAVEAKEGLETQLNQQRSQTEDANRKLDALTTDKATVDKQLTEEHQRRLAAETEQQKTKNELAQEKAQRETAERQLKEFMDNQRNNSGSSATSPWLTVVGIVVALIGGGIGGWLLNALGAFRF